MIWPTSCLWFTVNIRWKEIFKFCNWNCSILFVCGVKWQWFMNNELERLWNGSVVAYIDIISPVKWCCITGWLVPDVWWQHGDPAFKGPLKMRMSYWPKIPDTSHPVTHCNITEEWRTELHCCKGLKTCLNQVATLILSWRDWVKLYLSG